MSLVNIGIQKEAKRRKTIKRKRKLKGQVVDIGGLKKKRRDIQIWDLKLKDIDRFNLKQATRDKYQNILQQLYNEVGTFKLKDLLLIIDKQEPIMNKKRLNEQIKILLKYYKRFISNSDKNTKIAEGIIEGRVK